jgi:hypothetical protein
MGVIPNMKWFIFGILAAVGISQIADNTLLGLVLIVPLVLLIALRMRSTPAPAPYVRPDQLAQARLETRHAVALAERRAAKRVRHAQAEAEQVGRARLRAAQRFVASEGRWV